MNRPPSFASSTIALLLLAVAACAGGGDTAADTAATVADEGLPTEEALIADRVAVLCSTFPAEVASLIDETDLVQKTGSCNVRAEQFLIAFKPEGTFYVPMIAEACVQEANVSPTFEFWMWCFSAWQG